MLDQKNAVIGTRRGAKYRIQQEGEIDGLTD